MAAETGVNANTVRAVYARLEAEGVVATEHGRGTFVTGATGENQLATIAQRAAEEARAAGVDPRAVAAALFVGREPDLASEATRRRALRDQIADLEDRLSAARLQRRLATHAEDPLTTTSAGAPGRLLSAAELEAIRDELAERLALLEDAERVAAEPAATPAQPSTAPSARVTLAPGAPHWRLGHTR